MLLSGEVLNTGGNVLFGAEAVIDVAGAIQANTPAAWAKTAENATVGTVAMLVGGVPGWVIGTSYFIMDTVNPNIMNNINKSAQNPFEAFYPNLPSNNGYTAPPSGYDPAGGAWWP
jgi:hypothetical protein